MRAIDPVELVTVKNQDGVQKSTDVDISIVITVTERCQDLLEIVHEISDAIGSLSLSSEFLVVFDAQFAVDFRKLMLKCGKQEQIRAICFTGNFGESAALKAGFELARGRWLATLAAYPQVAAAEFGKVYQALESGADMVVTRREPRTDPWINRVQTFLFHKLIGWLTGSGFRDMACGFRVFSRKVAQEVELYGDLHRFLPALAVQKGFKVVEVPASQHRKNRTLRLYPLPTYVHRLVEILNLFFLTKFAKRPLRFFGSIGLLLIATGGGVTATLTVERLLGLTDLADRPLFLLGVTLFFLGVQVILLGLIGEIIVFAHARDIQDYRIEKIHN
jgi:glycosyltransferase involved in cell wall biosynthesis